MDEVQTISPNFVGTPDGYRRVGFRYPNGRHLVVVVPIPPDWNVSVFIEADSHRTFCVGSSPDNQQLRASRWLAGHGQTKVEYATLAEQQAALSGSDAATATHAALADLVKPLLTAGDAPVPVVEPPIVLTAAVADEARPDGPNGRPRRPSLRDYAFRTQTTAGGDRLVVDCRTKPSLSLVTHSSEGALVAAFRNGPREMYFLFTDGADYLLECVRIRYAETSGRLEARAPQASHTGQTPQQVVEALAPALA